MIIYYLYAIKYTYRYKFHISLHVFLKYKSFYFQTFQLFRHFKTIIYIRFFFFLTTVCIVLRSPEKFCSIFVMQFKNSFRRYINYLFFSSWIQTFLPDYLVWTAQFSVTACLSLSPSTNFSIFLSFFLYFFLCLSSYHLLNVISHAHTNSNISLKNAV